MKHVVYGDFTCPACYLLSRRADLVAYGPDAVDWRAVEHHRLLPLTGRRPDPDERGQQDEAWGAVLTHLLPGEDLPGRPSATLVNTRAAVAGYAEAYGAGVAERARRLLFAAHWVDGQDIANPDVLRVLLADTIRSGDSASAPLREWGYAVSTGGGPVTSVGFRLIRDWQHQWQDLGEPREPVLVSSGSPPVTGDAALAALGSLVGGRVGDSHELVPLTLLAFSGRFWY